MIYRIGEYELDTAGFELRFNGAARPVEPLVFDLLRFFSENPGRILTRDEIIEQVWNGRIVSEATISSCVKSARKALGDNGESQTYIQTVRGRGFRFTPGMTGAPAGDQIHRAAGPANPDPSLIVLPFEDFSGDPRMGQLADSLVENLTTVLTRVPLLGIVSRATSFALKGKPVDARELGQSHDVNYMLEGSLQGGPDTLIANVQLIETARGTHLWAQQFVERRGDGELSRILKRVLPQLEPQLMRAMQADLAGRDGELTGRQLLLRAMSVIALKGWHSNSFAEARDLLYRAIELEPELPLAHAYLALILGLGARVGLLSGSPDDIERAIAVAERALELDSMDSAVLGLAGCALADVGQAERAVPVIRKAIAINPNNAQALSALGSAYLIRGNVDDAIRFLARGIEISPMDNSRAVWGALLACAYMQKGDLDAALERAHEAIESDDRNYMPRVVLAALLSMTGDRDAAVRALSECYRVKPDLTTTEIEGLLGASLTADLLDLAGAT